MNQNHFCEGVEVHSALRCSCLSISLVAHTQLLLLFTMATAAMIVLLLLSSLLLDGVVVDSFQLSCSNSNQKIKSQLQQQHYYAIQLPSPLFASTDGEDESSSSSTTTFAASAESIGEKVFAELDKMRQNFAELTESLTMAKEREEQAKEDVTRLTEEKANVEAETDNAIAGRKRILRYV